MRIPFRDPTDRLRLLVGGMLSLVPFVNFIAWGYLYRVFVDGLNRSPSLTPPSWEAWRTYWSVGLRLFVITLGYLILIVFAGVAVLGISGGDIEGPQQILMVGLLSMAAFNVISPVIYARYAEERRIWAAFEPDVLFRDLRQVVRVEYVQLCLLYLGLWMMTFLILVGIPYVGPVFLSIFHFYLSLVFAFVFGHVVAGRREATDLAEGS
ncbi:MAG: hypothetical protein CME26_07090 [Gemmatimonadetes bacterium]|nr:hypothetical protein [Gemmatimonadota bacterium]